MHPTQRGSKLKLAGLITRSEESRGEIERKLDVQGWTGTGENSMMHRRRQEKLEADYILQDVSVSRTHDIINFVIDDRANN